MWFVIKPFADMKDKDHSSKGDPFPKEVSEERTKKLSSKKNLQETPLKVSKKRAKRKNCLPKNLSSKKGLVMRSLVKREEDQRKRSNVLWHIQMNKKPH